MFNNNTLLQNRGEMRNQTQAREGLVSGWDEFTRPELKKGYKRLEGMNIKRIMPRSPKSVKPVFASKRLGRNRGVPPSTEEDEYVLLSDGSYLLGADGEKIKKSGG